MIGNSGSVLLTANLERVLTLVKAAGKNGLTIIWGLNYYGLGWAPTGLNVDRAGIVLNAEDQKQLNGFFSPEFNCET